MTDTWRVKCCIIIIIITLTLPLTCDLSWQAMVMPHMQAKNQGQQFKSKSENKLMDGHT